LELKGYPDSNEDDDSGRQLSEGVGNRDMNGTRSRLRGKLKEAQRRRSRESREKRRGRGYLRLKGGGSFELRYMSKYLIRKRLYFKQEGEEKLSSAGREGAQARQLPKRKHGPGIKSGTAKRSGSGEFHYRALKRKALGKKHLGLARIRLLLALKKGVDTKRAPGAEDGKRKGSHLIF